MIEAEKIEKSGPDARLYFLKDLLPPLISIPFVGDLRFLPEQLKKNLEWMFFLGFCSPFKGSYTLQDEYRDRNRLEEMAENMEKVVSPSSCRHDISL